MGLDHVSLELPPDRLADCVSFWSLLGFEPVQLPDEFAGRVAWVIRGRTAIHLIVTDDDPVIRPPRRGDVGSVAAAGFEPEPQTEYWGAARAFVREPAGHRVEVMAAGPPYPGSDS